MEIDLLTKQTHKREKVKTEQTKKKPHYSDEWNENQQIVTLD